MGKGSLKDTKKSNNREAELGRKRKERKAWHGRIGEIHETVFGR